MGVRRQNNQLVLALPGIDQGESLGRAVGGTETSTAARKSESSADVENLMEEVCERGNLERALKRVESNRGSPGVDGMSVGDLRGYLVDHWPAIREQLLNGAYKPMPVKRVDIPKPGGGVRQLGVPTVLDRFIQQAVLQILQAYWDHTFSEHSYGFRPGRSAHQAVTKPESTDGRREGRANWDEGAYKGESLGSIGTDVTRQRVFSSRTGPRERSMEAGNRVIVGSDAAGCTRGSGGREFEGVGSVADSAVRLGVGWLAVGPGREWPAQPRASPGEDAK